MTTRSNRGSTGNDPAPPQPTAESPVTPVTPADDALAQLLTLASDLVVGVRANGGASATMMGFRADVLRVDSGFRWIVSEAGTLVVSSGESSQALAACAAAAAALLAARR